MTRDECIAKYHHQLWGIMLDVSRIGISGSERSIREDLAMKKIDACIGSIWDNMQPKQPVPQPNGVAKPAERIIK